MLVKCIKAFGLLVPGDVAEVPDGAAVDPDHFAAAAGEDTAAARTAEAAAAANAPETPPEPSEPAAPAAFPPAGTLTPKEM